jgi:primosomal protein N' (replication factor Y) (superfamily II helicase)
MRWRFCIQACLRGNAWFAPLENLGLIVIDEEHETTYKQDESPRYHGRDTAIMRAVNAKAVVVIGSATPSLESFHNAHVGKSTYIKLESRYGNRPLADVVAVDMRLNVTASNRRFPMN